MKTVTTKKERDFLKNHFQVILHDTLLDAAFLGYHGRILTDDINNPKILFVDVGHTYYYYGDASAKEALSFVSLIEDGPEIHASAKWEHLIREVFQEKVHDLTRFAMDDQDISITHLEEIVNNIPKDLVIKQVDRALYDVLLKEQWTSAMVENFADVEEYLKNGFGFVLLNKEGDILSGASSFARYSKGYEVEIGTHQDHRRKGYALLIGAHFIKETMKQGKHAHWDAQNIGSRFLAEQLGYTLKKAYNIIEVY